MTDMLMMQPHHIERGDDILGDASFLEDMSDSHAFSAHDFFHDSWDLATPPESPGRPASGDHHDLQFGVTPEEYLRASRIFERDLHPPLDHMSSSSVMWSVISDVVGEAAFFTPPPSPGPLSDLADSDFSTFQLEDSTYCEADLLASGASRKRKCLNGNSKQVSKRPSTRQPKKGGPPFENASLNESDDPDDKRFTHNVLERKRRNELKYSYSFLREQIPDLHDNEKAATGLILNRACEYIAELKDLESRLLHNLQMAKAENMRLKSL